jgi:hypothetical protein
MTTQVRLFISAGPAEEPAREWLAHALARWPINLGWVIKRSPNVDAVAESHLFVLLFGADIVAPVGLELWWARRTEKPILAYASPSLRTPAGQVFWQENAGLDWARYHNAAALRRAFNRDIRHFLLAHAARYELGAVEVETLRLLIAQTARAGPLAAETPGPPDAEEARARGASGGGVILAPGKDAPRGARVVRQPEV